MDPVCMFLVQIYGHMERGLFFFFFGFLAFCSLLLALRMDQSRTLPGGEMSVLS